MRSRKHPWGGSATLATATLLVTFVSLPMQVFAQGASVTVGTAQVGPPVTATATPLAELPALSATQKAQLEKLQQQSPLPGPALPQVGAPQSPLHGTETNIGGPSPAVPDSFLAIRSTPNPVIPLGNKSNINEPSTGMSGRVRFMTGNWYAAYSNNSAATWTYRSPFTTFPASDGGFCCDQVALYEPSRDMMVWLLQ